MNGQRLRLTLMPEDFIQYNLIIKTVKKLSLEMLRLSTHEILERSQMKKITGGYGTGSCFITCSLSNGGSTQHRVPNCSVGCLQGIGSTPLFCSCN